MYKVLLVDDEQLILEGLCRVLPWDRWHCQVAGKAINGEEGLRMIREIHPDILMTDIRMPNVDGLTMIAAARSEFPRMQITVLTAYRDFEYAHRAINLGVTRYLLKPSKLGELQEAIEAMTEKLDTMPGEEASGEDAENGEAGNFIVTEALRYMRAHCTEHIALSDVAEGVYVSQWHLSKLLNKHTGQSFFDLLGNMRVEEAKVLLANPALRVHEVAERTGYTDVAHFSKSFKKISGMTPGEYRQQLAEGKK